MRHASIGLKSKFEAVALAYESKRKASFVYAALMLFSVQLAFGQEIAFVNTNAPPGGTGQSWATAYDSLHSALADPTVGEIWVAKGVYRPDSFNREISFVLRSGVEVLGGFKGDEVSRVERDWVANETVLSGDLFANDGANFFNTFDNSFHVVSAEGVDNTAILDGFTVAAGYAEPGVAPVDWGAGIYAPNGHPVLRHCRFIDHQAAKGGSVYASGVGVIVIEDCSFENSVVKSRGGAGAIHLDQVVHGQLTRCDFEGNRGELGGAVGVEFASALITDCTFANGLSGQRGGAIGGYEATIDIVGGAFTSNRGGLGGAVGVRLGKLSLVGAVFSDNFAQGTNGVGGAVDLYESEGDISDCTFERNSAWQGGAIRTNFSDLVVADCVMEGNIASDRGGGICFENGQIEVRACDFVDNDGGKGGAISLSQIDSIPGVPTLHMSNFLSNHADGAGGALFVRYSLFSMIQCRLMGNSANSGGGAVYGGGEFTDCIFSGNITNSDFGGAIKGGEELVISQCTIVGNKSNTSGGGIYYLGGTKLTLANSILWDNISQLASTRLGQFGYASIPSTPVVEYICVEGGIGIGSGMGLVTSNPMFVDGRGPDLVYGTMDDDLIVKSYSPCRDAGANDLVPKDKFDLDGDNDRIEPLPFDIDGAERFINDFRVPPSGAGSAPLVDMGAFEAMPSECTPDLDPNGVLDIFDFLAFQNLFVTQDPRADLDHSTGVGVFDIFDFLVFQTLFSRGCGP